MVNIQLEPSLGRKKDNDICGIVYAHDFSGNPVNNGILQQFDKQRSRGVEGFGLFDGEYQNIIKESKEDSILKWLVKYDSSMILFHHRRPTSTINVKRAAHPFSTKDYFGDTQYILVHNGMIWNSDELFDEHIKEGIEYQSLLQDGTFNDSEALLWDVALFLEGKQEKLNVAGGIAFICIKKVKGKLTKMFFGRNTNPLNMYMDKGGITLSSEGKGDPIDRDNLYIFNYDNQKVSKMELEIPTATYKSYSSNNTCRDNQYTDSNYDWKNGWKFNEVLSYDRDGNPTFMDKYYPEEDDLELYSPSQSKVNAEFYNLLCQAYGNFETAYLIAENEYEDLLEDDSGDWGRICLLEEVMEAICADKEYVNEKAVSSMWEAIWKS